MNILELYLYSVGASFSIYEYLIVKNNYLAIKNAKKNLKYKKGLSTKSKEEQKILSKELRNNLLIGNAINLGFSIVPVLNVVSIPFLSKKQDAFGLDTYDKAVKTYDKINKIENKKVKVYKK